MNGDVGGSSLDASQWADLSVFKGDVVCLTGAPRRSCWANYNFFLKKGDDEGDDEGLMSGPFQK